jgi:hypothetical protein
MAMHEPAELREQSASAPPKPGVVAGPTAPLPAVALAERLGKTGISLAQRSALAAHAGRHGGNRELARAIRQLQRNGGGTATAAPPGRGLSTPFGDYWIVPDATDQSYADVIGEQITETEFAALQQAWNTLVAGTGQVRISENDDTGVAHPGFAAHMLAACGQLMSKPAGRGLLVGLIGGSQLVTIQPTSTRSIAAARRGGPGTLENLDGSAGTGGTTTIMFDDDFDDKRVDVFDAAGKRIAEPLFTSIGHELIHAKHNAEGHNRRNLPSTSTAYPNLEEQETIETGALSENTLRAEHGLPARRGHALVDNRP